MRRILAEWRPTNSGTILLFERSTMTADEIAKYRSVPEQAAAFQQKEALKVPVPSDIIITLQPTKFLLRFGERPNYPPFSQ